MGSGTQGTEPHRSRRVFGCSGAERPEFLANDPYPPPVLVRILAVEVEILEMEDARRVFRIDRISKPHLLGRLFETSVEVIEEMLEGVPHEILGTCDA